MILSQTWHLRVCFGENVMGRLKVGFEEPQSGCFSNKPTPRYRFSTNKWSMQIPINILINADYRVSFTICLLVFKINWLFLNSSYNQSYKYNITVHTTRQVLHRRIPVYVWKWLTHGLSNSNASDTPSTDRTRNVSRSDHSQSKDFKKSLDNLSKLPDIKFCNVRSLQSTSLSVEHQLSSIKPHFLFFTNTQILRDTAISTYSVFLYSLCPQLWSKPRYCAYVRKRNGGAFDIILMLSTIIWGCTILILYWLTNVYVLETHLYVLRALRR